MMNDQQTAFWKILSNLSELDVLDHVIIIGSWAEYLYEFVYEGFTSNLKTKDVDMLYKNYRKPDKKIQLIALLKERGFAPETDGFGITRFFLGRELELEFLVSERGAGQNKPYKIEPLGIEVEGLRLSLLLVEVISIKANGYNIAVPGPWAYVLHKLIINSSRGAKSQKDIDAIRLIVDYFSENVEFTINLARCYRELTKKQKLAVDLACSNNYIDLNI